MSILCISVGFRAKLGLWAVEGVLLIVMEMGSMAEYEPISIREFCELPTPVLMFDKDGAFVVMKLEQVCRLLQFKRSRSYSNSCP